MEVNTRSFLPSLDVPSESRTPRGKSKAFWWLPWLDDNARNSLQASGADTGLQDVRVPNSASAEVTEKLAWRLPGFTPRSRPGTGSISRPVSVGNHGGYSAQRRSGKLGRLYV